MATAPWKKAAEIKKDKPVKDLEICPEEAAVVKEIFERTVYEGAGSFILATELSARGVRTHHGAKFNVSTVNKILRDRQYLGYLITQDITSPHLPELQIIDEALFNAAQEITEQRKTQNAAWRNIPRQNCSGVLLGGNLYCAACGSRMTSSSPGEGAKRPYAEYICYMGANHRVACSGQKAYVAKRVDDLVLRVTGMLLNTIQDTPKDESIEKRVLAEVKDLERQLADTRKQADEAAKAQEALEMEVSRCLMGQSQFTAEMLSKLIEQAAQKHKALNHTAAELEQKLADQKKIADGVQTYYDRFLGWSMEFGMASLARKRIIIAQLFKRIELDRGYNLHFEVDWNYEQFIDSVNVKGKQGITAVGITLPPKVRPKAGKTAKASQTAKNGRKRKAEPISA